MTWTKVDDDEAAAWDSRLQCFADHNVYQSWRWGQYKTLRGWRPHRFRVETTGNVVGMLQALVRVYAMRHVVAWCPGGPVGTAEAFTAEMMHDLARQLGARALYCRCSILRPTTPEAVRFLESNGWRRPSRSVGTNTTAVWDLSQTEEQLLAGMNRNWRYSLRQAHKAGLVIERLDDAPIEELAEMSAAMHASKGVAAKVRTADLAGLFDSLGDNAVAFGCRNEAGRLIAFHSCAVLGQRAWELVAATADEGRRNGASFAALWAVVDHCRRMKVTRYDLAGVDDVRAPGPANFKRWTGAEPVEWVGEWEWSTSPLLTRVIDAVVRTRSETALP